MVRKTDRNGITVEFGYNLYSAPLFKRTEDGAPMSLYVLRKRERIGGRVTSYLQRKCDVRDIWLQKGLNRPCQKNNHEFVIAIEKCVRRKLAIVFISLNANMCD